jgi:hypothetical protein
MMLICPGPQMQVAQHVTARSRMQAQLSIVTFGTRQMCTHDKSLKLIGPHKTEQESVWPRTPVAPTWSTDRDRHSPEASV